MITSGDTIRKNPEMVRKMIMALREGWRAYLDDPTATNAVMAKLNREMSADMMANAASVQKDLIETKGTPLGEMAAERWQTLAQQLVELSVISKAAPPEEAFTSLERLVAPVPQK